MIHALINKKNIQMLNNIKSFVVFVFVLSVFIGSSISYGIIYPLRLISPLLMIAIMLFYYDKKPILTFINKLFFWFIILFFSLTLLSSITGYISLFIIPKLDDALNFFMIFIVLFNFILIYLLDKKYFLKRLSFYLKFVYLIFLLIAIFEIFTFNHLSLSRYNGTLINIPTVFFYNENDFAAVFTLIFLFLITHNNLRLNFLNCFLFIIHFGILIYSGARISSFILILFLLIYRFRSIFLISLLSLLFLVFSNQNLVNEKTTSFLLRKVLVKKNDASQNIRFNLYKESLKSVKKSFILGYGINSSASYLNKADKENYISNVRQPHSFQLELLINGGIIVFIFFIIFNVYVFYILLKKNQYERAFNIVAYNVILFSSSSSLFIWPIYLFLFIYMCWADEHFTNSKYID